MPTLYSIQASMVNDYLATGTPTKVEQEMLLCDSNLSRLAPRRDDLELRLTLVQAEFNFWASRRNACQHALAEITKISKSPRARRKRAQDSSASASPTEAQLVTKLLQMSATDRQVLLAKLETVSKES